jgi:hypothetical protein
LSSPITFPNISEEEGAGPFDPDVEEEQDDDDEEEFIRRTGKRLTFAIITNTTIKICTY